MYNTKRTTREANGLSIEKVVDKRWKGKAEYLVKWQGVQTGKTHTWVSGLAINSDKGRSEVCLYERQQPDPAGLIEKPNKDFEQVTRAITSMDERFNGKFVKIQRSLKDLDLT